MFDEHINYYYRIVHVNTHINYYYGITHVVGIFDGHKLSAFFKWDPYRSCNKISAGYDKITFLFININK